jgi:hypothetical protein
MKRLFAIAFCVGLAGLTAVPQVHASNWNKRTLLTVNETIQVPGAVLEPGKYVMKLHDSLANRNIVQIFNEEENKVLATILAIPHYRIEPSSKTELHFWEREEDQPPALRTWFFPGDLHGQEFIYPKGFAIQIAKQTHTNVPTIAAEPAATALERAPVETVDEAGVVHSLDLVTFAAEILPAELGVPVELPALAMAQYKPTTDLETLPATASIAPLIALIGIAGLGAGVGLRLVARRIR